MFDLQKEIKKAKLLPKNYPGCPRRNMKKPCESLDNTEICYYCGRDLLEELKYMKKEIIGFTCGAFDLTHAGHYMMFEECRDQCDKLVVGLQTDPSIDRPLIKHKPIQTLEERMIQVGSCKWVDDVIVYNTEEQLIELIKLVKPDVRFVGEDHKNKDFTGKDMGIPIIYNSRTHNYSSSSLIERIRNI